MDAEKSTEVDLVRKLEIHGAYRHFKGGRYVVEGVAKDSETEAEMVVYRGLYGKHEMWVRPLAEFLSEVDHKKYPDVEQKYRFELEK